MATVRIVILLCVVVFLSLGQSKIDSSQKEDIVYIGNLNPQHYEVSKLMLDNGKHVLCEKPFTMNEKQTRALVELSQRKKLFLMEAVWSRCFPAYIQMRKLIDSGAIGDVLFASIHFGHALQHVERLKAIELGGGAILDLGVYILQFQQYVFRGLRPVKIAVNGQLNDQKTDESAGAIITYPGGKMAVVSTSARVALPNEGLVVGTKGTIKMPDFWCPTQLITSEKTYEYKLPQTPVEFFHKNSAGLAFQAEEARQCILSVVVTQDVEAVEGKSVSLPCDVTPPNNHDKVYMVFWFQQGSGYPIYSFDVRGKPLSRASHWSAPDLFGTRAYFRTVSEPAQLVIDDIRRHDEGVYRCRVDFRNAQTRSFRYNLTVIVPPEQPTILDKWGRQLNGTVGPHEEGDDITLTCRTVGGHPQPLVRWLINADMVDDQYEHNAGDVIEYRLVKTGVTRKDLDAIFTCQAINTVLTEPKVASVVLDLLLKPLTASILKTVSPLVADKRYEVTCESAGSRPPAVITWYKGKRPLRRTKQETRENVTISELSFVPTTEDDGKSITCRAENPNVTGLFLETSWKIEVVYPPQVSLHLGSTLNADDIKEGDDVYFECRVTANPQWRKLTWLHNGFVLNHNMSGRIIHSNQSLVLQKVTRQSAGRYVCSVVNSEGETTSNELNFRVQYVPTCRFEKIMVVGASRGESVDIVCEIDADPPAKSYRWKFNNSGETLDVAAERFAKTSNGTVSVLRYTPVSELDYGSLSCWAVNAIGHQINPCVFQVVAAGKPFPVRNCSLSNQTSSSVEVMCLAGFDGGLPQHFLLELYSASSATPRYNMTALNEPYFFLDNLEPDVTFRIVVFAVNAKGRSHGVVLEEVTFRDAEKRTASDGELPFSPVLGVLIGATATIIIVILVVIIRVRRSQSQPESTMEQKVAGGPHHNTMSSTKPLLRSASPRDTDERDPDVIPAKYGSPDGESDRNVGSLNGPQSLPLGTLATSPNYAQTNVPAPQWVSPVSVAPPVVEPMYHLYNNPVAMVGTFPRDSRPKDLRLGNGSSSTLQKATDLELNGLAIKERLMANRLPESCV